MKPAKRRLIQLYAALLYNCSYKGFLTGRIYTGPLKNLCVPGLNCYSCPGAIAACPLGALQNALASSGAGFPAYILGVLAMFGLLLGRTVCGFLCPIGLIQELLHKVPVPKLKKNRFTRLLTGLKYVVLAVFVVLIPLPYAFRNVPTPAFCKFICPAGTLEGAVGLLSVSANNELFAMLNAAFTRKFIILVLFIVISMFVYRWFCRFLCPLGAIYGFFNRIAMLGMTVDESRCTGCGVCTAQCRMDVRRVGDRECIQCGECRNACPHGAVCRKPLLKNRAAGHPALHRFAAWCLAAAVLAAAVWYTNPAPSEGVRSENADIGMQLTDFSVPLYGGGVFRTEECRGKVTVINFWATYCSPCCRELPDFQRIYDEYGDSIRMAAIHVMLSVDDVGRFIAEGGYTMPFAYDENGEALAAANGSELLPRTVVLDAEGKVIYNEAASMSFDKLSAIISAAQ